MTLIVIALLLMVLGLQVMALSVIWPKPKPAPIVPLGGLDVAAYDLTAKVEPLAISGEAKRHQVYAALIKQFPTTPKRDLAYAIERVIQQRHD